MVLSRFGERVLIKKKIGFRYNSKVDAWSLGVVILECYFGEVPSFGLDNMKENLEPAIEKDTSKVQDEHLKHVAKSLLETDPTKRQHLPDVLFFMQSPFKTSPCFA